MTDSPIEFGALALQRQQLIALWDAACRYTKRVLDAVTDPARVVHPDSGWTVTDVTAHILVWDQAFARTLTALETAPAPPADTASPAIDRFASFDDFNRRQRDRLHGIGLAQLRDDLVAVRARITAALRDLPPERFEERIAFPWPAEGPLSTLVLVMAAHEREHAREIAAALGIANQA